MNSHAYTHRVFRDPDLDIRVEFNSPGPLDLDHPYVALSWREGPGLFFPENTWDLVSVSHEAIHAAYWVVYRNLAMNHRDEPDQLEKLVPRTDVAWTRGIERVREEAVCKLHDTILRRAISELEESVVYYKLSAPRLRLQRSKA